MFFQRFIDDGTLAHQAKVMEALQRFWHKTVPSFGELPGSSPNLSPIKNLWNQMKHAQKRENAASKIIARLVLRGITLEYKKNLFQSMPRRMQAVVDNRGGHTKY